MAQEGWISINRQIQEHWIWTKQPFSWGQAWIDLLLLANHEDKKVPFKGEVIVCKRGDINRSLQSLSKRWRWSLHKVSDFLNLLESDNMVEQKRNSTGTVITIVNYDVYQLSPNKKGTQKEQKRNTKGTRKETNNNDNNDNNISPLISPLPRRETQLDMLTRLMDERNLSQEMKQKLSEWIIYKTERKETYVEMGMKRFLSLQENNEKKYGTKAMLECIDNCMSRGWQGIITDIIGKERYGQRSDESVVSDLYKGISFDLSKGLG